MVESAGSYRTRVGSQQIELPLVPIADALAIALLITVDHGVNFVAQAGRELAEVIEPFNVDVVVSVATMGIPLAIEVTRALGLDDYLILQKTPKIHLADAIDEPVTSITTGSPQRLLFDRARVHAAAGKRVAVVDDVISTGASVRAALNLMRRVGAEPVVVGALVTEAATWRQALGADADLVHALGALPLFRMPSAGGFVEDWEGGSDSEAAIEAAATSATSTQ
jgi:adenine/guanine phosphoribosyltransferase-like PRPP-binding protein